MRPIVLVLILAVMPFMVSAQNMPLSKAEKKALKKELKFYKKNLEAYRLYKEQQEDYIEEIDELEEDNLALRKEKSQLQDQVRETKDSVVNLNEQLAVAQTTPNKLPEKKVYQIQVGVFKNFDIRGFLDPPKYFNYEEVNGMYRYTIGYFEDEETAKRFLTNVRKMGIKDAFITKYEDGERQMEWSPEPVTNTTPTKVVVPTVVKQQTSTYDPNANTSTNTNNNTTTTTTSDAAKDVKLEGNWKVEKDDKGFERIIILPPKK